MRHEPPPVLNDPRILLQGERYRLVEDERPDANGVPEKVHTLEVLDGYDAMGGLRWIDAQKRDALAVYAGAVRWLQGEVSRLLRERDDAKNL